MIAGHIQIEDSSIHFKHSPFSGKINGTVCNNFTGGERNFVCDFNDFAMLMAYALSADGSVEGLQVDLELVEKLGL